MAAGDITSGTIRADGWTADIRMEGLGIEGLYDFGLGADNDPRTGTPLVVFNVTSLGFDDDGVATTIARTVYGVLAMRQPYPDEADNEESFDGTHTTVRVVLSDYIYEKDNTGAGKSGTAVTMSIGAGFYEKTGVPNNATGSPITCTNNSTVPYQKVVGNWSWVGYQRVTGNFDLRCVAFHRHGQENRPVRVVKYLVDDQHSHTFPAPVTTPSITEGFGDAVPVVEYVGPINVTTLDALDVLTCNFEAYPWVGDDDSVLRSADGAAAPSPLVGPITMLNDKSNSYGVTCALVDPTGSDSGANTVYDAGTFNPATAYKFASISEAASAIAAYNNSNHGRNDVGAGIVYCNAGSYAWLGNTNSYGTTPACWITIKPTDGVARADVIIASASGNGDISDRVKVENCTITVTTSNTFTNIAALWFDQCDFNTGGTGLFNTVGGVFSITRGLVRQLAQGLRPASTANCSPALIRGNDLTGFAHAILTYTVLGNKHEANSGVRLYDTINGMLGPRPVPIVAFNRFLGVDGTGGEVFKFGEYYANTEGLAFVQNVFEHYTTGSGGLGAFGTYFHEHSNYIIWHNTLVGQRVFMGYNSEGGVAYHRKYWSQINNIFDRWANKCDNDIAPNDGAQIGGWPVKFNVGSSGCYLGQILQSLPGNFYAEFAGLSSFQPPTDDADTYNDSALPLFGNRESSIGTGVNTIAAGSGQGDYDIQAGSPLLGLPLVDVLGFDHSGVARSSGNTAAGAYAGPVPTSTLNATTTNATTVTIGS